MADQSRSLPPPLPGGYAEGDIVYWTASRATPLLAGDRLVHGDQGSVAGPYSKNQVCVSFLGCVLPVACQIKSLSRVAPPPLPGGYAVGETVYFTGSSVTLTPWPAANLEGRSL